MPKKTPVIPPPIPLTKTKPPQVTDRRTAVEIQEAQRLLGLFTDLLKAGPAMDAEIFTPPNPKIVDAQMEALRSDLRREDEYFREHGVHIWAKKPRQWYGKRKTEENKEDSGEVAEKRAKTR